MPWPPPSTLPDTPFPSRPLAAVAAVAEALLSPGYWALDRLLALLVPTTAQRARWRRHRAGRCLAAGSRALLAPALLLALLLALPPALLGLLLWLPAQAKRRPFVHQYVVTTAAAEPWDPRRARGFTFLTANVCLLPSGLARFSNLGRTRRRAEVIGRILAAGGPGLRGPGPERPIPLADPMPPVLSARIPPDTDFVCLQEVFDGAAAAALRRQLGRRFPHVLWGVGPGGLRCGRLRALGSGLLLGSRFPLLAARFRPFPNAAREDALANKGLLVAQVRGRRLRGRRVVGYLGCTHLQAPAGEWGHGDGVGGYWGVTLGVTLGGGTGGPRGVGSLQCCPAVSRCPCPAVCMCLCRTTPVCPSVPVSPCVCPCVRVSPCPQVSLRPCVPLSPCPCVHVSVFMCPHVPLSPCPCVCVPLCLCVCVPLSPVSLRLSLCVPMSSNVHIHLCVPVSPCPAPHVSCPCASVCPCPHVHVHVPPAHHRPTVHVPPVPAPDPRHPIPP
uniref:sphingomyelin phosphodiesterase n=1 Tax=Geospiza parvula TaxID=87175 RepID=A0A8U8AUV3_GEOPR